MKKAGDLFDKYASFALVCAFLAMFALIFLNVILRFFFASGVAAAEELSRIIFLWLTFLGAYLAVKENKHIGISGLLSIVNARYIWVLKLAINMVKAIILAVVLAGAWEVFLSNLGGRAPVSGTPIAIAFAAVVVGAASMLIVFCHRFVTILITRRAGQDQ